jgi:predicted DNA-binding transcriptional regulator YafY
MGNAVDVAKRLNYAREVWAEVGVLPAAVERLMRECSVGRRQAYRDLRRARRLKGRVPIPDATIAYTVKLSRGVVRRLRAHAEATDRTISDIVSRAIVAQLARSGGRG